MRATVTLALVGAAAHVLANAHPGQLHEPVAVAVAVAARHAEVDGEAVFYQVDATSNPKSEATRVPAVISDTVSESKKSWAGVNTTVTVDGGSWFVNTTNTPATPLPTEDSETTDSKPAEVTGGALPQPMKASAAGLLGFFIMSLVML